MSEKLKKDIDLYLVDLLTHGLSDKKKTQFYQNGNNLGYSALLPLGAKYLTRPQLLEILKGNDLFHMFTGPFFLQGESKNDSVYVQEYKGSVFWVAQEGEPEPQSDGSKFETDFDFSMPLITLKLLEKFKSGQLKDIELFGCIVPPGFSTYGANHFDLFNESMAQTINWTNKHHKVPALKINCEQMCSIINNLHYSSINRHNCYPIANFILKWLEYDDKDKKVILNALVNKFSTFFQKIDNCNTFYNYILQHHNSYARAAQSSLAKVNSNFENAEEASSFTFNEGKIEHIQINISALIAKYPAQLGATHLKSNFDSIIKRCIKLSNPIANKSSLNIDFIDFYGQEKFGKNIAFKTKQDFVKGVDDKNVAKIIEFAFESYINQLNVKIIEFKKSDSGKRIDFDREDVLMMFKSYNPGECELIEQQVANGLVSYIDKLGLEVALGLVKGEIDTSPYNLTQKQKGQATAHPLKNNHKI